MRIRISLRKAVESAPLAEMQVLLVIAPPATGKPPAPAIPETTIMSAAFDAPPVEIISFRKKSPDEVYLIQQKVARIEDGPTSSIFCEIPDRPSALILRLLLLGA